MGIYTMCPALLTCTLIMLAVLIDRQSQACPGEDVPREVVLLWLKQRILEELGLEEPPLLTLQRPLGARVDRAAQHGASRVSRATRVERRHHQETSQVILFPSSDSTCLRTSNLSTSEASSHFTYYFQPSLDNQESVITSAHFWFYAGEAIADATPAPLYILTSHQELLQVAKKPAKSSPDGWTTYRLDRHLHTAMEVGPFMLQVRCPVCSCYSSEEEDKTPFLHLHTRPHAPDRARRASSIPWSPNAIEKLQRPSSEGINTDCKREQIEISFQELGWDNWIVHPKVFNFHYCHGNCSSLERTTTLLGINQCCAPVPESMKSLRFTTTSDGGFSFKYETLPNIIPEDCNCI
ncbi:inhibin alpha chain [Pygocentrus nattereri]|uniref:Inhibin alpha chain n=1 Tax=Pygocentrus nattereri TaxID=42514 RepID=A0A3B4DKD3_PYGNA|nr:inhibin alpha chain [Pygocentrus nattereri]